MKKFLLFTVMTAVLSGCELPAPPAKPTPLEIQALQSRQYEQPKEIVFASVVSVFQDLGYTIKSADKDTGFITAESASNTSIPTPNPYAAFEAFDISFGSFSSTLRDLDSTHVTSTAATAFIEQLNETISLLRLNFVKQTRVSGVQGQTSRQDKPLLDATTYQNAFERIENAIFIRAK